MQPQPLICCNDVQLSSRWYQRLLNLRSAHGGPNYERLETAEGVLVLQLHAFDVVHDHGAIGDAGDRPYGNGLLLWFEVTDFEASVDRAAEIGAEIIHPSHSNPPEGESGGPNHWEIWLRDPDGYKVVLASPDGTANNGWAPGMA